MKTKDEIKKHNKNWKWNVPLCPQCHVPMQIDENNSDMDAGSQAKWNCDCGFVSAHNFQS